MWKVSLRVASVLVPGLIGILFFVLTVKLHYHHDEAVAEFGERAAEGFAFLLIFIGFLGVCLSLLLALLFWGDRGRLRTVAIVMLLITMTLLFLATVIHTTVLLPRAMRTQDNVSRRVPHPSALNMYETLSDIRGGRVGDGHDV